MSDFGDWLSLGSGFGGGASHFGGWLSLWSGFGGGASDFGERKNTKLK